MGQSQVYTTKIDSYELKESREGSFIPSINGVHLHSAYNPIREAENFIENNQETLINNSQILLLGLGLGHHLTLMTKELQKNHDENFKIFVIEPIDKLFEDAKRLKILPNNRNIYYYTTPNLEKLYRQKEILNFLVNKPGIVIHIPSFNFNRNFFETFLSYRSDQRLKTAQDLPLRPKVISYYQSFNEDLTTSELGDVVRQKRTLSPLDHLALSLQAFKKDNHSSSQGEVK